MQRDVLRTYPGALAAVGAAARHMEGADDMEHLLLKGAGRRLVGGARRRVVEHALLAGAGRADVPAGVAADAARQLVLPEGKALVGGHALQLLHLVEAVGIQHLAVAAQQLVIGHVLFGLAVAAAVGQQLLLRQGDVSVVQRMHQNASLGALN